MKIKIGKKIIFILKISITIVILFFIFKKINFIQVIQNFNKITIFSLISIILTAIIKLYLQFVNWAKYLKLNPDYKPGKHEILKSFFIGEALRFLLPGGYGTFGKIYFVNNQKKATTISIGLEKFFQIWMSLLFAVFASLFYFQKINVLIKIVVLIIIIILPLLIYLLSHFTKNKKNQLYFRVYLRNVPLIMLRQILFMLITILQYFIIILNFKIISFLKILIAVPLILSANLIPITYAGLGLRESFAISVFSKYSITAEIAVTCSLTIFIINTVLPSFIGVIFLIFHKKQKPVEV